MARISSRSIRFRSLRILVLCLLVGLALFAPLSTVQRAAPQQPNRQLKRESAQRSGERRIALVIGNGAYQNVKPLKNPPNDATLLAATLRKLGFEVTIGTDRSQREMKQLIREFDQRLRGGCRPFLLRRPRRAGAGTQLSDSGGCRDSDRS